MRTSLRIAAPALAAAVLVSLSACTSTDAGPATPSSSAASSASSASSTGERQFASLVASVSPDIMRSRDELTDCPDGDGAFDVACVTAAQEATRRGSGALRALKDLGPVPAEAQEQYSSTLTAADRLARLDVAPCKVAESDDCVQAVVSARLLVDELSKSMSGTPAAS
jgi:hypothetical protein